MNHIRRRNYWRTHLLVLVQTAGGTSSGRISCASGHLQEWNPPQEADHRLVAGSEQEQSKTLVAGIGKAGNIPWVLGWGVEPPEHSVREGWKLAQGPEDPPEVLLL